MTEEDNQKHLSPMEHISEMLGNKWSMHILYALNAEKGNTIRFTEINRRIGNCSRKTLSVTLQKLIRYQLIKRTAFIDTQVHVEYSLTDKGKSLMNVITPLMNWTEKHFQEEDDEDNAQPIDDKEKCAHF